MGVYLVNVVTISAPGGGFFGDYTQNLEMGTRKIGIILLEIIIQSLYFWWSCMSLFKPIGTNVGTDTLDVLAIQARKENTLIEEEENETKEEKEEKAIVIEDEQEKQEKAIIKDNDEIS